MKLIELANELGVKTSKVKEILGMSTFTKIDIDLTETAEGIVREKLGEGKVTQEEEETVGNSAFDKAVAAVERGDPEPTRVNMSIPYMTIRLTNKTQSVFRNGTEFPCQRNDKGYFMEVPADNYAEIKQNLVAAYGGDILL